MIFAGLSLPRTFWFLFRISLFRLNTPEEASLHRGRLCSSSLFPLFHSSFDRRDFLLRYPEIHNVIYFYDLDRSLGHDDLGSRHALGVFGRGDIFPRTSDGE